jgi:ribose-phosphate pyrophosphokinase
MAGDPAAGDPADLAQTRVSQQSYAETSPVHPTLAGETMSDQALELFVLNSNRLFGEQVAHRLGMAPAPHDEREFEDGEHKARPLVNVRGRDVYVIQSLHGDSGQSPHDKLCRLLFFIGALKDAAAARVSAVVPYLAYSRKDSKTNPRDPVTSRYVAAMFEAVGTDAVLTMDVHNLSAFQNGFRCGTEHLDASELFAKHFQPLLHGDEVVVVAPDTGAVKRANRFRKRLEAVLDVPVGTAFVEKYRKADTLTGELLVGEVAGKTAVIFDDMISSGRTVARAAQTCHGHGARRVFAVASHGLFSAGAREALNGCGLERVVVTDSIAPFRAEQSLPEHLTVLSCTALFAEAIKRMHGGASVSDLASW